IAARRAAQANYEAIEIHAGHGYLLHQFLSPHTNKRNDIYGGSRANRMRMLIETIDAVRSEWPRQLPLFVRLSCVDQGGWEMKDTIELVKNLALHGVDVVDCSAGGLIGSPLK